MSKTAVTAPVKSHLPKFLEGLLQYGWTVSSAPLGGKLLRNGQKILLRADEQDLRLRLFLYKITESSRNKPEERRIEITSTYPKGLDSIRLYRDVVLGYETELNLFVGIDPERLKHGGPTGNASSFIDIEGIRSARDGVITILQRKAKQSVFARGFEFQAFFSPDRLAEYLFNRNSIHAGTYENDGEYSGRVRRSRNRSSLLVDSEHLAGDVLVMTSPASIEKSPGEQIDKKIISIFERGEIATQRGRTRRVTPEEFLKIKRAMEANGVLGEEHVLDSERRRLRRAGLPHLAEKIRWTSRESVSEGYDISSFEEDGSERFIEVKASIGNVKTFEMSNNEWIVAGKLGKRYYICRVSNVRSIPTLSWHQDPQRLERHGRIQKTASGWRITLR